VVAVDVGTISAGGAGDEVTEGGVEALDCGVIGGANVGEEMAAGGGGICECPLMAFWRRSSIWSSSTELFMKSVRSPFLIRYSAGTTMMGTKFIFKKEMISKQKRERGIKQIQAMASDRHTNLAKHYSVGRVFDKLQ